MSATTIPTGTYQILHIGNKPQETEPIYVKPEPTGDELLDEILELQAFRAHHERERAYADYQAHFKAMLNIGKNMVYAHTTIMHLSKAKRATQSTIV